MKLYSVFFPQTLATTLNVTLEEHLRSLAPATNYAFDRLCYQMVQLLRRRLNFKYYHLQPSLFSAIIDFFSELTLSEHVTTLWK